MRVGPPPQQPHQSLLQHRINAHRAAATDLNIPLPRFAAVLHDNPMSSGAKLQSGRSIPDEDSVELDFGGRA